MMDISDIAVQVGIMIFSGLAAWLSMDHRERFRKWAPVIGLVGQPFWAWSALESQQFGVLAMTAWFTIVWCRGIRNYWWKN